MVLEAKVEAVTDLLGLFEAENVNLKKNLNKGYTRESRNRISVDIVEEGGGWRLWSPKNATFPIMLRP